MFSELSHEDAEKSSVRRRSKQIVLAYNTLPKQKDRLKEGGGDPLHDNGKHEKRRTD